VPLNEIKTVTLDYQSRSSITLTKVLFKFFWKLNVNFLDAKPGFENEIKDANAAVVIGDRTFDLNGKYNYEYDLALEWKNFTGLPFVFAAWVSTKKLSQEFITEFNSVLKFGVENILKAVNEDFVQKSLSKDQTINYLVERIDYNLNSDKRKALELFLDYIKKL
jgi:chorismate dehydratase